ncbi:hypothetical protein JAO73_13485 [Hymenobacter sp. BT523]|uniref:hypothetical protein n=1 Tax=Hymenobacter sp. BT523 TaxID=2795725 RepID=UPI0018ED1A74|nr:hypothetical protein [Hymenobacter sp. BT523]MBJ6110029.1 hypothetical protein [Hymenobacter sp. BT523]
MKTSNKWLAAALLLLLGSLSAFNMALRTQYKTGAYKNPTSNTVALSLKDFTEIDVQAASLMGVKITSGPYAVRVSKEAQPYVKVTQRGPRLSIALAFPEGEASLGPRQSVVAISCPQLNLLTASATYVEKGKVHVDKQPGYDRTVLVQGFAQDSLVVRQDLGAHVTLAGNRLGYLRAEAGQRPGSRSALRIANSNRIQAADLSVQRQAELQLEAGVVGTLRTQFGDSARATVTGGGLRNLGQHRE